MTGILDIISKAHWAITPAALENIKRIAARDNTDYQELVAGKQGARLNYTYQTRVRDGVAIIPLYGPVFPKANMMSEMSGATSLQKVSHDLAEAVNNPEVKAIIIDVDSPGGVAFGPAELSEEIRAASKLKPVVAYVSGLCCSAAYWISSGATEIVAHSSALLGSIGVVTCMPVQKQPDQNGDMYVEITSTNAKNKRPDPLSDEGRAEIIRELDDLEAQFVGGIAAHRGITREKVLQEFGNGACFVAEKAVEVGMADRTGDLESLIKELSSGPAAQPSGTTTHMKSKETSKMDINQLRTEHPDIATALMEEGAKAERERINAIDGIAIAGHEKLIADAKADGKSSAADVALRIVQANKALGATHLATTQAAVDAMPKIEPSASNEPEGHEAVDDADLTLDQKAEKNWNSNKELHAEFGDLDTYKNSLRATESGRGRILKPSA